MTQFILAHDSTSRLKGSRAHAPNTPLQSTETQGREDTDPLSSAGIRRQSSWKVPPAPPGREAPVSPGAERPGHTNLSDEPLSFSCSGVSDRGTP